MTVNVTLVLGSSIDGKLTTDPGANSKEFGEYASKELHHQLHMIRSQNDAILTTVNTIITDDSSLTVRLDENTSQPLRVVLDPEGKIPENRNVLNDEADTVVATTERGEEVLEEKLDRSSGNDILMLPERPEGLDLKTLKEKLSSRGIEDLMIESGGTLNHSLFKENLVDELKLFVFPMIVGGKDTPTVVDGEKTLKDDIREMELVESEKNGDALINTYRPV